MVTATAFHILGEKDEGIFLGLWDGEGIEMADGTLGYHGFDFAMEDSFEASEKAHLEARCILDHLRIDCKIEFSESALGQSMLSIVLKDLPRTWYGSRKPNVMP